jgi:hypothetical protein
MRHAWLGHNPRVAIRACTWLACVMYALCTWLAWPRLARADDTAAPVTWGAGSAAQQVAAPSLPAPLDEAAFARSLEREHDYYRAIGEWKVLRFRSTDPLVRGRYSLAIAEDYLAAKKFESCVQSVGGLRRDREVWARIGPTASRIMGECYLGMHLTFQAEIELLRARWSLALPLAEVGRTELALARADAEDKNWLGAARHGREAQLAGAPQAPALLAAIESGEHHQSRRSPLLAGLLSTVLPGAGQAYSGHWVDAAQSFLFVGAFLFTTAIAYSYENSRGAPLVLTGISASVTALFHSSNIWGAVRTAAYYNQRQQELRAEALDRAQ